MRVQSILLAACQVLLPAAAVAGQITCVANQQCRGDAQAMCAPSSLEILVTETGPGAAQLWIDRQGPYAGTVSQSGKARVVTLEAFGSGYRLELSADGQFRYLGNRGKRFTGTCAWRTE